jgi:hypothetical protein
MNIDELHWAWIIVGKKEFIQNIGGTMWLMKTGKEKHVGCGLRGS